MKRHYPWLWFDADGTLFDYNRAESTAFQKAFASLEVPFEAGHLETYRQINHELWQALERQAVNAEFRTRATPELMAAFAGGSEL